MTALPGDHVVSRGLVPTSQATDQVEGCIPPQRFRKSVAETECGEGDCPAARDRQPHPGHLPDGQGIRYDRTFAGQARRQGQHDHQAHQGQGRHENPHPSQVGFSDQGRARREEPTEHQHRQAASREAKTKPPHVSPGVVAGLWQLCVR